MHARKRNETKEEKEYCWAITHRRWGGHAAADHISVCWSFDLIRTYLYIHEQLTIFIPNYALRKNRPAQDLHERASMGEWHMHVVAEQNPGRGPVKKDLSDGMADQSVPRHGTSTFRHHDVQ